MADTASRRQLAVAIRRLAAGRLSWEAFDRQTNDLTRTRDRAVRAIWWAAWTAYDPDDPGYPSNRPGSRRLVARWILFLYTDLEYRWPDEPFLPGLALTLLNALTLGLLVVVLSAIRPDWKEDGDMESMWPFFDGEELARATAAPVLLSGSNRE